MKLVQRLRSMKSTDPFVFFGFFGREVHLAGAREGQRRPRVGDRVADRRQDDLAQASIPARAALATRGDDAEAPSSSSPRAALQARSEVRASARQSAPTGTNISEATPTWAPGTG